MKNYRDYQTGHIYELVLSDEMESTVKKDHERAYELYNRLDAPEDVRGRYDLGL